MNDIDTLVFDYGGVIVNLDNNKVSDALCTLGVGRIQQVLQANKIKKLTRDFIDGIIPTDVTMERMLKLCRTGTTCEDLVAVLNNLCGNLPSSRLQALKDLKRNYRVLLLSNISDILWEYSVGEITSRGFSPEDCFDAFYLSYEMGVAKPDKDIYLRMISDAGIIPSRTIYFDDRKDNYEAGLSLGFHSVLVPTNHLEDLPIWSRLVSVNNKN